MVKDIQKHFAQYLGKTIWSKLEEKEVILKSVRSNCLSYQEIVSDEENETIQAPEVRGNFNDFFIIVEREVEAIAKKIPEETCCMINKNGTVSVVDVMTPAVFLQQLKDVLYPKYGLTDEIMMLNRRNRKREYAIPRQLIMAAFFCAWEGNEKFHISQQMAADIFRLDHATALHSIKVVNAAIDTDRFYREQYAEIWELVLSINKFSRLHIR